MAREDRPWPEWRRGKALTERQLAKLLEPFKIGPTKVRIGDKALQGYVREDLMDTFRRYLPSLDPEHRNK